MSESETKVETRKKTEKDEKDEKKVKKPRRCCVCKKRTLTNIKCKCKLWTCITHLNKHDCAYDWQQHHKKKLDDILIKVEFRKVNAI